MEEIKVEDLRNMIKELKDDLKSFNKEPAEEAKQEENTAKKQTTPTCEIQIVKTSAGMPLVNVQGNVIDVLGLLEYAKMYLNEEVEKFISAQKNRSQEKEESS